MALDNLQVDYLIDPAFQIENLAGKPAVGGHVEVFEAGTDTKVITYQDFDGNVNPFKIPLHSDGRAVILADPSRKYDFYVYDSFNNLMFSRLNVTPNLSGNISIKGCDVYIYNTDGTLDITQQSIQNNIRRYEINTKHKSLGVEAPLYFVEDSDTATIIGFSGDDYVSTSTYNTDITNITNNITALSSDVDGKMDVSKLEYNENGEISAYDGSAFAGQGDPEVNELVHANSAEWNEVSAKLDTTAFSTVSGDFLTAIPEDYATKDYVQSSVSSKLDTTAFSTVSGNFLTAHQSLDGLMSASLLGMSGNTITSYNDMPFPIGGEGDAEVNQIVHTNSADWNDVSAKLDTTAFSTVSGNFLTAHQSLDGYLTKSSADTLYQPIGDYATHDDLTAYQTVEGMTAYQPSGNYADATALDGKVDTSSFTAFSSTTNEKIEYISGALSGSYELSAGDGIDITDYPNEQKTVISVTAQGGDPEVENLVIANSATWDSVTGKADATALNDYATTAQLANKLDTTAFSTVSGSFLTAHQSLDGYATTTDVESAVSSKLDTTAFSTVSGSFLTAHQDLSDYATTAELADKLDTSAFSDVSGTFLTAHQDISNKLDTTAFSDVSASFLTAVPNTYLQNTDLATADGKVTAISGIPLSAGGDVPEGVMVESGLEFNAANEISGYNGSAISQYGAEKQWLTHDDTIVHVSNSAQYAFGVNLSGISADLARMMGVDETVLFSTATTAATTDDVSLSESRQNFERLQIFAKDDNGNMFTFDMFSDVSAVRGMGSYNAGAQWIGMRAEEIQATNDTTLSVSDTPQISWTSAGAFRNFGHGKYLKINKVIGIGRKN